MRLLIDTHAFFWSFNNTRKLSKPAVEALISPGNEFFVSIVSIWEMQIKVMLKKMDLGGPIADIVSEQTSNGIQILSLEFEHALNLENLPPIHKDPFDRMLISQALVEEMTIVTADKRFAEYDVKLIW